MSKKYKYNYEDEEDEIVPKRKQKTRALTNYERKLTPKQAKFVMNYIETRSAYKAAKAAGFQCRNPEKELKKLSDRGQLLLKNPIVIKAIRTELEAQAERTLLTSDRIISELADLCFFDPAECFDEEGNMLPVPEMSERARKAIAAIDIVEMKDPRTRETIGYTKKLRFVNKDAVMDKMMKHFGMIQGGTNITVNNNPQIHNTITANLVQNELKIASLSNVELDALQKLIDSNTSKIDDETLIIDAVSYEEEQQKDRFKLIEQCKVKEKIHTPKEEDEEIDDMFSIPKKKN